MSSGVKQRTFEVDGEKIIITSRPRFHLGNLAGYTVLISGRTRRKKYKLNYLTRQEAEDAAYIKWVQDYTASD